MLQLGLLRVISWPGSRFKKQRIKARIICTHPLFVIFSKPKLSWSCVRPGLSLCFDIPLMVQILMIYSEQVVIFALVVRPLAWFLLSLSFFAWTVSFSGLQSAGCPSLVSLLYWFWLFGLFIYDFFGNDFLSLWLLWTVTVFGFWKTHLVPFIVHLDQLRELPCPRLWLRVLIFENKNSYFFGPDGLTRDYHPYNSSV